MRKFIRNTFAVLIFSLAGYTSAASEITRHDVTNLMPLGYISVGNLLTLDEVINALDDKAEERGATYFRIIYLGGKNKIYGTAIIYR